MRATPDVKAPEFTLERPLGSALDVLRAVILRPRRFFLGFSAEGPVHEPGAFVLLVSAFSAFVGAAASLVSGELSAASAGLTLLVAALLTLLAPLALGAAAGAYLLSIRTFVGGTPGFREVYRMLAYAYAPMVLAWVPVVSAFAFTYSFMVLMLIAVRTVYRTSLITAVITALVAYVPVATAFLLLIAWSTGLTAGS